MSKASATSTLRGTVRHVLGQVMLPPNGKTENNDAGSHKATKKRSHRQAFGNPNSSGGSNSNNTQSTPWAGWIFIPGAPTRNQDGVGVSFLSVPLEYQPVLWKLIATPRNNNSNKNIVLLDNYQRVEIATESSSFVVHLPDEDQDGFDHGGDERQEQSNQHQHSSSPHQPSNQQPETSSNYPSSSSLSSFGTMSARRWQTQPPSCYQECAASRERMAMELRMRETTTIRTTTEAGRSQHQNVNDNDRANDDKRNGGEKNGHSKQRQQGQSFVWQITSLIEVKPGGLTVLRTNGHDDEDYIDNDDENNNAKAKKTLQQQQQLPPQNSIKIFSLAQWKRLQLMGETTTRAPTTASLWQMKPHHCSMIRARVKAVSPILNIAPNNKNHKTKKQSKKRQRVSNDDGNDNRNNPSSASSLNQQQQQHLFSLVQLHQYETVGQHHIEHECVAVLRRGYLQRRPPPRPGQVLLLRDNVPTQPWRIPSLFATGKPDDDDDDMAELISDDKRAGATVVPHNVFVVEEPDQLMIEDDEDDASTVANDASVFLTKHTVQGTVRSCHWIAVSEQRVHINYIELQLDVECQDNNNNNNNNKNDDNRKKENRNNNNTAILFLTYFPMDHCLQWSMSRPGARIRAVHVTPLNQNDDAEPFLCAATVRSSVVLLEPSPEPISATRNEIEPLWYTRSPAVSYYERNLRRVVKSWLAQTTSINDANGSSNTDICALVVQILIKGCRHRASPGKQEDTRTTPKKKRARNVYAEFFWNVDSDSAKSTDNLIVFRNSYLAAIRLFKLQDIQQSVMGQLQERLSRHHAETTTNNVYDVGWTASFVLSAQDFSSSASSNSDLWTGGRFVECTADGDNDSNNNNFSLNGGGVTLPCVVLQSNKSFNNPVGCSGSSNNFHDNNNLHGNHSSNISNGDSVLVQIQSAVVSLLCVSTAVRHGTTRSKPNTISLQVLPFGLDKGNSNDNTSKRQNSNQQQKGPCFWVASPDCGCCFLASCYLVVSQARSIHEGSRCCDKDFATAREESMMTSTSYGCSIRSILDGLPAAATGMPGDDEPIASPSGQYFLEGILLRRFWRPRTQKGNDYTGFRCTLGHSPTAVAENGCENHMGDKNKNATLLPPCLLSLLQTIEIKTQHKFDTAMVQQWGRILNHSCNGVALQRLRQEHLVMSLAWFLTACSAQRCALLTCGFDDINAAMVASSSASPRGQEPPKNANAVARLAVLVQCPVTSRQQDAKRGYVRFSCRLGSFRAQVVSLVDRGSLAVSCTNPSSLHSENTLATPFDFIGATDHVTGMPNLRPYRMGMSRGKRQAPARTEFLAVVHSDPSSGHCDAIPECTLGQIMSLISTDIHHHHEKNDGGTHGKHLAPSLVRQVGQNACFLGIGFCQARAECQKCFEPLRRLQQTARHQQPSQTAGFNPKRPRQIATTLRCPNGHGVQEFGAIKWECSGTLDDGTGQAKLYAERNAALLLMGLGSARFRQELALMEEGAWRDENGITFSKAVSPRNDESMRQAVLQARENAQQKRCRGAAIHEAHVLEQMNPIVKANYLLQRFCRLPNHPCLRPLTYFVRCKPLSDETNTVHQTEIRLSAAGRDAADGPAAQRMDFSYSIPPLKLILVDAMTTLSSSG